MPPWGETPADQVGPGGVSSQPSLPPPSTAPAVQGEAQGEGLVRGGPVLGAGQMPCQCASLASVTRILPEARAGHELGCVRASEP